MLVWNIGVILGVSVDGGHVLAFVKHLLFLRVVESGC
jgi:hypothetical protein